MRVSTLARVLSFRRLFVPLAGACLLGLSASAAILSFDANLDGLQVVPPNVSPGIGTADLTLDTSSGLLTITSGTYQDLLGNSTTILLQGPAAAGANGPVIMLLTNDTFAATGTFSGGGTLTAGNMADMIATNTYITIRSTVFPGGEIRGQIFAVPEPSSVMLAGIGILGLVIISRRRK